MKWTDAIQRKCPRCGAEPTETCIGRRGPRKALHLDRYGSEGPIRRTRATRCNVDGFVYFIGPVNAEMVKIGWSKDHPTRRLKELQTGNGAELHIYGAIRGTRRKEKALHSAFEHLHLRGEWFTLDRVLFDFILGAAE